MNAEALRLTRETGEMHFFSRSRQELWHKGATSGNTLALQRSATTATRTRCSRWSSRPGPACHTGERSCFHRGELDPGAPYETLPELERTIAERRDAHGPRARTPPTLLDDPGLAGAKVQEEAEEVVSAAREESDERVAEEAADVIYHLASCSADAG